MVNQSNAQCNVSTRRSKSSEIKQGEETRRTSNHHTDGAEGRMKWGNAKREGWEGVRGLGWQPPVASRGARYKIRRRVPGGIQCRTGSRALLSIASSDLHLRVNWTHATAMKSHLLVFLVVLIFSTSFNRKCNATSGVPLLRKGDDSCTIFSSGTLSLSLSLSLSFSLSHWPFISTVNYLSIQRIDLLQFVQAFWLCFRFLLYGHLVIDDVRK